jgi:hypothetical protein
MWYLTITTSVCSSTVFPARVKFPSAKQQNCRHSHYMGKCSFEDAKIMSAEREEEAARSINNRNRNRRRMWAQVYSLPVNIKVGGNWMAWVEQANKVDYMTLVEYQLIRLSSLQPTQFCKLQAFSCFSEEPHFSSQEEMKDKRTGFFDVRVIHEMIGA